MRLFLPLVTLAALASTARAQNVLLVVADDLGTDKVASYDPASVPPPTPTLDGLAADGVQFRNAWACPVCSPTRATLMTGRYPFRHGVVNAIPIGPPLSAEELTLPRVLDLVEQGGGPSIATGAFGKWHLGPFGNGLSDPLRRGFDTWVGTNLGAFPAPFSYFFWPETNGTTTTLSTTYATTATVDAAASWIADRDGPWFCYLSFHAPHTPFHAPPEELHGQDLPNVDPESDPVPFYDAMVEAMDAELGRLLDGLPASVRAETTVIIVGDNGSTGDVVLPPYDPARSKGSLYRNGIRVPLIVSGAAVNQPGREVSALADVSDLFATVLDLLDVDWEPSIPSDLPLDSVSLAPYVEQVFAAPQRDWILSQVALPLPSTPPAGPTVAMAIDTGTGTPTTPGGGLTAGAAIDSGIAIRGPVFKLIRRDNGSEQLFNLLLDPNENTNLLEAPVLGNAAAEAYEDLGGTLDQLLNG